MASPIFVKRSALRGHYFCRLLAAYNLFQPRFIPSIMHRSCYESKSSLHSCRTPPLGYAYPGDASSPVMPPSEGVMSTPKKVRCLNTQMTIH